MCYTTGVLSAQLCVSTFRVGHMRFDRFEGVQIVIWAMTLKFWTWLPTFHRNMLLLSSGFVQSFGIHFEDYTVSQREDHCLIIGYSLVLAFKLCAAVCEVAL